MTKIKGIPVVLLETMEVGKDPFGAPIIEEVEEIVEDVLVSPSTTDDRITPAHAGTTSLR